MTDETHDPDPTIITPSTAHPSPSTQPQDIGPYHLAKKLGEGGMGVVWLAEQSKPVRRRVALKVIKQGMDTREFVARFEVERQALAMMDHPLVAKVFDAGATPDGLPYFVMEYVAGVPITTYCDEHRLGIRDRLVLFQQVCEGVQHAHTKAIIHRDLKPSNILTADQDGKPAPKIIDFGLAKAAAQKLTDQSMHTQVGAFLGTPDYMSPEQASLSGEDVDTRTDVYALGVILYELLVGALPFDREALRSAGYEGIRQAIREAEPPRPSRRLSSLGAAATEAAQRRGTDPSTLARTLKGDLNWIVLKALEKDRLRRYGSPAEFAADITRYLQDEPVTASPPSTTYRTRKFVRRHRVGVIVAGAAVLFLMAFAVTMTVQANRIADERDRANRERVGSDRVARFLADVLAAVDAHTVGNALWLDLQNSVATSRRNRGGSDAEVAVAVAALDDALSDVNKTDTALHLLDEQILRRFSETIDEELGDDGRLAAKLYEKIGMAYWQLGLWEQAEFHIRRGLALRDSLFGPDHLETLYSCNSLGELLKDQGKLQEAVPLVESVLAGFRLEFGPEHTHTLTAIHNMGDMLQHLDRLDEAEPYLRESLAIRRRVLGNDHASTLNSLQQLGSLLGDLGRLDEAEPYYLEALEGRRRALGDDHPHTLASINNMAGFLSSQGKTAEAEPYYREALAGHRRVQGDDHPRTMIVMGNYAGNLNDLGRFEAAEVLLVEALTTLPRVLPRTHLIMGVTLRKYGVCLTGLGRYAEAEEALLEGYDILDAALGSDHVHTRKALPNLVALYDAWGQPEKAEEWRKLSEDGP